MLIKSILLKNLLSFGPDTEPLELQNLNVLIGPNGSGKSNLIEAISLLQAAPRDIKVPVREGGGIDEWLWRGDTPRRWATLEAVVNIPSDLLDFPHVDVVRHAARFGDHEGRFYLSEETISAGDEFNWKNMLFFFDSGAPSGMIRGRRRKRDFKTKDMDNNLSILSQIKDPDHYPELTDLGQRYEKIKIYRDFTFGRRTIFRDPQRADMPNDLLLEDGSNFGLALNTLRRNPKAKKIFLDYLRFLNRDFEDFDVKVEGNTIQVFLTETPRKSGRSWIVPASRASDGTLRYLWLLAILLHPNPPPLICVEEPELGLHPDMIGKVADLLRDAATRTQLVVTTHSDILVDAFTETPEAVIVCEKHAGATQFRRLERKGLAIWLKNYSLGELWVRGDIGGNRW
jgi:predicted ATPase